MIWLLYIVIGCIALAALLYLFGNYTFWLPFRSAKLPRIVMLHQVTPHDDASGMNMPPQKFEQLLQYLVKKRSSFCFVSELDQYQGQKHVVALSFDEPLRLHPGLLEEGEVLLRAQRARGVALHFKNPPAAMVVRIDRGRVVQQIRIEPHDPTGHRSIKPTSRRILGQSCRPIPISARF